MPPGVGEGTVLGQAVLGAPGPGAAQLRLNLQMRDVPAGG